ncbi:hypothetical protein KCP76_13485 [Salmonella enterica subsp. enterica serovar Weltevreden]|nr:hypothetical protein KCP76_13485 [Salmonella enterica subsp. enterica serovar Weltevreden]
MVDAFFPAVRLHECPAVDASDQDTIVADTRIIVGVCDTFCFGDGQLRCHRGQGRASSFGEIRPAPRPEFPGRNLRRSLHRSRQQPAARFAALFRRAGENKSSSLIFGICAAFKNERRVSCSITAGVRLHCRDISGISSHYGGERADEGGQFVRHDRVSQQRHLRGSDRSPQYDGTAHSQRNHFTYFGCPCALFA